MPRRQNARTTAIDFIVVFLPQENLEKARGEEKKGKKKFENKLGKLFSDFTLTEGEGEENNS
jgi:hypothetical protein